MSETTRLHATTISLNGTAVMIRGPSGSGKSDLALRVLESSGHGLTSAAIVVELVADDQTILRCEGGQLWATAPENTQNLLEVRGQGILQLESRQNVPLALVVELRNHVKIERMPQPEDMETRILGVTVPLVAIDAAAPSAPARLRTAWARLGKLP